MSMPQEIDNEATLSLQSIAKSRFHRLKKGIFYQGLRSPFFLAAYSDHLIEVANLEDSNQTLLDYIDESINSDLVQERIDSCAVFIKQDYSKVQLTEYSRQFMLELLSGFKVRSATSDNPLYDPVTECYIGEVLFESLNRFYELGLDDEHALLLMRTMIRGAVMIADESSLINLFKDTVVLPAYAGHKHKNAPDAFIAEMHKYYADQYDNISTIPVEYLKL